MTEKKTRAVMRNLVDKAAVSLLSDGDKVDPETVLPIGAKEIFSNYDFKHPVETELEPDEGLPKNCREQVWDGVKKKTRKNKTEQKLQKERRIGKEAEDAKITKLDIFNIKICATTMKKKSKME